MVEIAHQSRARATQYNVKKYCTTFRVMRDTSYLPLPLPLPLNGPWVPPTNCYVSNITNEFKIMSASKTYSLSLSMNSMPYQIPNVINNWCIQTEYILHAIMCIDSAWTIRCILSDHGDDLWVTRGVNVSASILFWWQVLILLSAVGGILSDNVMKTVLMILYTGNV